jgi:ligand-binding sensor domain-containing protein/serine phosphatase RsbU (regulator of sigma subunit)
MSKAVFTLAGVLCILVLRAQQFVEPAFSYLDPEKFGANNLYHQQWDKHGGMWMASEKGLVYYNGYSTQVWSKKENTSNSLLDNSIQALYLDSKNILWISYPEIPGITKFDVFSHEITHILPDSSSPSAIPRGRIVCFQEDSKENFWVLTWGEGLFKMDRESGTCIPYKTNKDKPGDTHFIPNNIVKAMLELKNGNYLLGFFEESAPSAMPVYFDAAKGLFEPFPVEEYLAGLPEVEKDKIRFSLKITHFIYEDTKENIWFGTYSGLICFDTKNKKASRISGKQFDATQQNLDNARAYVLDDNNRMWIGSPNAGIMLVDPETKKAGYLRNATDNISSIADNRIRTLNKDADGNIWISTGLGGFSIYNPRLQQFRVLSWEKMDLDYSDRSGQTVPVNQMLVKDNGELYISNEKGITVYDAYNEKILEKIDPGKKLNANMELYIASRINNFKFMQNKRILLCSPELPAIYDQASKQYKRISNQSDFPDKPGFRILFRHDKSTQPLFLFTGRNGIIYEYNETTNTLSEFSRLDKRIHETYSYILKSGKWLLCSGEKDFVIFDPIKKSFDAYGPNQKDHFFPDSTINIAMVDAKGMAWFGTGKGLYTFDENTGKYECMNARIGIKEFPVFAIINDTTGVKWIVSSKKLIRWDEKNSSVTMVGKDYGLNAGSFFNSRAQIDANGHIYVASLNGVAVFNPYTLRFLERKPKVFPDVIQINEDTLHFTESNAFTEGSTKLDWDQNFLSFEFHSDQVYLPSPNRFYYRLIGLDTNWVDNGNSNKIRYTNLSAGSYTLEVKVKNAYDKESEVYRIPFFIARAFWATWWFYLLIIVVIAIAVYYYIRHREKEARQRAELLEQRIVERTAEVVTKAEQITHQKDIIEEKNKELTDSIHYALRIQQSILPEEKQIAKGLPEHFIFYQPKDIVSGDFYWYSQQGDSILWAVVDCTGHGVPGGFMSMLGSGLLNQIVNEEHRLQPDDILNQLRERVIIALKQTGKFGESSDGMDIILCRYLPSKNLLQMAGANNPLYIIRNEELIEVKGDKQPIGVYLDIKKPFTLQEITTEKGDMLYMNSDGYTDQFGGEKGKKFKTSNFEKLLLQLHKENMQTQQIKLEAAFNEWKRDIEQLDDVCVIGVRL